MNLTEKDIARFWKFVDRRGPDECWLWKGARLKYRGVRSYGQFRLRGKGLLAHRVSYYLAHGTLRNCVLHDCDVQNCVNPSHLWLGTIKNNNDDRQQKGRTRSPRGSKSRFAILNEQDVLDIVKLATTGISQTSLAAQYGVNSRTVNAILRGTNWAWLTGIGVSP